MTGHKLHFWVMLALFVAGLCIAARPSAAAVSAEAFAGQPWGVGRLQVDLPSEMIPEPLGMLGLGISEQSGRVFYPAIESAGLPPMVHDILSQSRRPLVRMFGDLLNAPPKTTLYFLFRGDGPLQLTLRSKSSDSFGVVPVVHPAAYRRTLDGWWRAYTAQPGLLEKKPDFPPVVENYLQSMLARRLDLRLPAGRAHGKGLSEFEHELGLTLGTEAIRVAMQEERMLGLAAMDQPADQPVPPAIDPPPLEVPEPAAGVVIEPIAMRVPVECLYVRFGNFSNFLWFQDTLARWNGDLKNLVALRGLDYDQSERVQRQLIIRQSAMARLLGDAVVADAAIVASDLFMAEGAAMGFLFQARSSMVFAADIARQRQEALKAGKGAVETTITVGPHKISLIRTPDNSIRSYYVADGDFHFITNSETLARRFLGAVAGQGALGASREFRYARSVMPGTRNDTVFVYLSDAFFRNLVSPQYRIETARRLAAEADIQLVLLARLASATEGSPAGTIDDMIRAGLLPPEFGPRPDGSRTAMAGGSVLDAPRGVRGSLAPVPDVPVTRVTPAEAAAYARFGRYYQSQWQRIEPMRIGVQRHALDGGRRERVTLDAQMGPIDRQRYDFLMRWLGPPQPTQWTAASGDQLFVDANLTRQRVLLGIRDFDLPAGMPIDQWIGPAGLLLGGQLRNFLFGYIGAVGPDLGLLELFNRGMSPPDPSGYAVSRLGVWRLQQDPLTLFSFHQEILANVAPQLRLVPAERPAQVRLQVADLSQVKLAPLLKRLIYGRSRETAVGNLRLIHAMREQFHVPGADARAAAELVLDAHLVCPMGGQLVYRQAPEGLSYWTTTALEAAPAAGTVPEGFRAPPLDWFRGLTGDAVLASDRITAHAEVDMEAPPVTKKR